MQGQAWLAVTPLILKQCLLTLCWHALNILHHGAKLVICARFGLLLLFLLGQRQVQALGCLCIILSCFLSLPGRSSILQQ